MTEHHGFDLEALFHANGGHSIFAPSSSYMILMCSGSLIPNLQAEDNAGIDAAEGTVGHEVGEEWLLRIDEARTDLEPISQEMIDEAEPRHLIGKIVKIKEHAETFEIEITSEMLFYVRQYVEWCAALPGDHHIEQRVYFSAYTPLPKQGGTADHAACWIEEDETGTLCITDLKYGAGVHVSAAEFPDDPRAMNLEREIPFNGHPQTMLYALGFVLEWDWRYNFKRIIIRIAQPRRDHFETWETTKGELFAFAEWARGRFALAWVPGAPRTPTEHGCRWCKVKATCAAHAVWMLDDTTRDRETDDVFDPADDEVIEGQFSVVTSQDMAVAKKTLDTKGFNPQLPDAAVLTTPQLAKLLRKRKMMESFFNAVYEELEYRAREGEDVPYFKMGPGREGDRKYRDEATPEAVASDLEFIGLDEEEIWVKTVISPARAEERIKAKFKLRGDRAKQMLAPIVVRAAGRPTLVPDFDKRPELEDVGEVFDAVEDDL